MLLRRPVVSKGFMTNVAAFKGQTKKKGIHVSNIAK